MVLIDFNAIPSTHSTHLSLLLHPPLLFVMLPLRGPKNPPNAPKYRKTLRSHKLFRQVHTNFCLLPQSTPKGASKWFQLLCLQLEASCLQLSFFAYNCVWELFCLSFYSQFELFCIQLSFFAHNGKVFLRSSSADCKQRSSTVSEKAPTVGKTAPPRRKWCRAKK